MNICPLSRFSCAIALLSVSSVGYAVGLFTFNESTHRCEDSTGHEGLNDVQWVECGRVEGQTYDQQAFLNRALMGIHWSDVLVTQSAFRNMNFMGSTVENVTVSGTYFDDTNFSNATIANSHFSQVTFKNTTFLGSNLGQSEFRNVDFKMVSFLGSDLRGVRFENVKLELVDFRNAIYDDATVLPFTLEVAEVWGMVYRPKN